MKGTYIHDIHVLLELCSLMSVEYGGRHWCVEVLIIRTDVKNSIRLSAVSFRNVGGDYGGQTRRHIPKSSRVTIYVDN